MNLRIREGYDEARRATAGSCQSTSEVSSSPDRILESLVDQAAKIGAKLIPIDAHAAGT